MIQSPSALSLPQLQDVVAGKEPVAEHVLDLLQTLQDSEEETRAWASDALQTLELLPAELAPTVATYCLNVHPPVAAWACKLLATLGSGAAEFQSAIVGCLNDHPSVSTKQQAALSLAEIPGLSQASLDALKIASSSSDPRLQRLATTALKNNSG